MKLSSPVIMAFPGPPRRASLARRLVLAGAILLIWVYLRRGHVRATRGDSATYVPTQPHPIDELIQRAEQSFHALLQNESKDLSSAAAQYRTKRGRHPPPGFDTWFRFAQEKEAVMVEDFFDQIYHDLGPFWGVPASTIRKEAWDHDMTIHVRGHHATAESTWFWTQIWLDLIQTIEHLLPDMSLALNAMDEPRIVVPWEHVNEYMELERATRQMRPATEVIAKFQKLDAPGEGPDKDVKTRPKDWEDTREWPDSSPGPVSIAK
jgi:hypothetical protein